MNASVVIGLSAVVIAIQGREAVVLTLKPARGEPARLPFGPFDPEGHRTFELALRAFVTEQTGFQLGYVEQLYTFGDKGRDAPVADVGAGAARVVSVGYLALTPEAPANPFPGADWAAWTRFFPWEDWRGGRPALIDEAVARGLEAWIGRGRGADGEARRTRSDRLFALNGAAWNDERVLERYELLYEAGLVVEAARDRGDGAPPVDGLGEAMASDHRRILATALGRLRGKLRYRPVAFELTPELFTLSELQGVVEAVTGVPLHKQNFRRALERTGLVAATGQVQAETGGRPAELYRYVRPVGPAPGFSLPALR